MGKKKAFDETDVNAQLTARLLPVTDGGSGVFGRVRTIDGELVTMEMIRDLHRTIAPSQASFGVIWTHCQIVAVMALEMGQAYIQRLRAGEVGVAANGAADDAETHEADNSAAPHDAGNFAARLTGEPDLQLLTVGALLHDIGTYRLLRDDGGKSGPIEFDREKYIFHGLEGWVILLENRFGQIIADFARDHTGVGLSAADVAREGLALPAADYVPETIEQELVMYADKFNSKSVPARFTAPQAARRSAAKFGGSNGQRFDAEQRKFGVPAIEELAELCHMPIRR